MAGVALILAGVIQRGQQAFVGSGVAPSIGGDRVRFVGVVPGAYERVYRGAISTVAVHV